MSTERVVLVTGATSGIGLGLARRYARTGAQLILTGRSRGRLDEARTEVPRSVGFSGDLASEAARERLAEFVVREFARLDVLVNNAGIQRRVDIASDDAPWHERQKEIDLLLSAPVHLVDLFTPTLLSAAPGAQIVNVTSGGAFTPQPFAPTYSAAKAAVHSYTVTLRNAFSRTPVAVTELIPPAVSTGLAGPGKNHGVDVDEFCDGVFPLLERRDAEVGFGPTASPDVVSRRRGDHDRFIASLDRFPVSRYEAARS